MKRKLVDMFYFIWLCHLVGVKKLPFNKNIKTETKIVNKGNQIVQIPSFLSKNFL